MGVYTLVCGRFFQCEKMCETFEFVCMRLSFAVATVNGKRQHSLATKSVSHALALQPLPWQPRLCTRRFLPLCFTRNGCWRRRGYNRALHFLSLFNNPESLVPTVDVGPKHSTRISAPPPPNPELDC